MQPAAVCTDASFCLFLFHRLTLQSVSWTRTLASIPTGWWRQPVRVHTTWRPSFFTCWGRSEGITERQWTFFVFFSFVERAAISLLWPVTALDVFTHAAKLHCAFNGYLCVSKLFLDVFMDWHRETLSELGGESDDTHTALMVYLMDIYQRRQTAGYFPIRDRKCEVCVSSVFR